jgi:acetyltransferase EpsM
MADVAIYGAGGLGRLVRDILLTGRQHRAVAFLDSDRQRQGRIIDGLRVVGDLDRLTSLGHGVSGVVVAIGDNPTRVALAEEVRARGLALISAIHPLASISPSAALGEHIIVGARVHICVHATIGAHCVLSAGSIIEHDNRIGRGAFLHPAVRLAGTVTVDEFATLGIGACVIPGKRVGRAAHVAPGSIVIADVPADVTVSGMPAREQHEPASRFIAADGTRRDAPAEFTHHSVLRAAASRPER